MAASTSTSLVIHPSATATGTAAAAGEDDSSTDWLAGSGPDLTKPTKITASLVPDVPVRGQVLKEEYVYYEYNHDVRYKNHVISIHAVPLNEGSDPDLYVSNHSNPISNKAVYMWKSTQVGRDRVDIHPNDPLATPGRYVIGVFGYGPLTDFVLLVTLSLPPPIHVLIENAPLTVTGALNSFTYFSLPVDPEKRCNIKCQLPTPASSSPSSSSSSSAPPPRYTIEMLASQAIYPSRVLHRWKSIPPSPTATPSSPVLAPMAAPATATPSSIAIPSPSSPSAIICSLDIDSDEFKYGSRLCHIAIFIEDAASSTRPPRAMDHTMSADAIVARLLEEVKYEHAMIQSAISAATPTTTTTTSAPAAVVPARNLITMEVVGELICEESALDASLRAPYAQFKSLFNDVNGSSVSHSERKKYDDGIASGKYQAVSLTYGEISFVTFATILELCKPQPHEVFYDLGSGSGKGVIAAHYLSPFTRCIGIELLTGLYDLSQQVATRIQTNSSFWKNGIAPVKGQIEMIHGDILKHDWWSTADVVYTSSICFEESLFAELSKRFLLMKKGARVVSLKWIHHDAFEVQHQTWHKMSWGRSVVYVCRKKI